jgi:hypothetical protein
MPSFSELVPRAGEVIGMPAEHRNVRASEID